MAGVAVVVALFAAAALGSAPAQADPGFCGVRVQGPTFAGGLMNAYTIRNKCRRTHRFAIRAYGRRTRCRSVWPRAYATFLSAYADPNWRIVNCVIARRADSGFCGVRNDWFFENGYAVYVVRNKCRRTHAFRVYLPGVRRNASVGCRRIGRRSFGYYTDRWVDPRWRVRPC